MVIIGFSLVFLPKNVAQALVHLVFATEGVAQKLDHEPDRPEQKRNSEQDGDEG